MPPAETAAIIPIAPNMAEALAPQAPAADKNNMKAAFDAAPAPASYEFSAVEKPVAKPVAAAAEVPAQQNRLTHIQSGIQKFLGGAADLIDLPESARTTERKLVVGKGDTLMDLLIRNDVPRGDAYNAVQALRSVYNPRELRPNHAITVFFHKAPTLEEMTFSGLQIERDKINTVMVNRGQDGTFAANSEEKSVFRSLKGYNGSIDGSLYVSAKNAGVPDGVILDLIRMYSWNVDFQRDIQPGDKFEVMYEEYATEFGDVVSGHGHILYAKLTLGGRDLPFYRYTDSAGETDYFDHTGHSAKKSLMKTPIDGARLSSGFGMRKHPILGYSKMHKGIDFAAPRGTPIYAAGDGTINRIGFVNGYGNYIRIRHRSDLQTAYAHMNGFRSGLKNGSRVKQGQVIGYVGTTGRSTGPHLHYEILVNGKHVNPNSVKLPTGKALAAKDMDAFKAARAERDGQFKQLISGIAIADATPRKLQQASR